MTNKQDHTASPSAPGRGIRNEQGEKVGRLRRLEENNAATEGRVGVLEPMALGHSRNLGSAAEFDKWMSAQPGKLQIGKCSFCCWRLQTEFSTKWVLPNFRVGCECERGLLACRIDKLPSPLGEERILIEGHEDAGPSTTMREAISNLMHWGIYGEKAELRLEQRRSTYYWRRQLGVPASVDRLTRHVTADDGHVTLPDNVDFHENG